MSNAEVDITIFDTTLRDGAQSLPADHQFGTDKKPDIADSLARLGVGVIEAGFPATPTDAEEVYEVTNSVGQRPYKVIAWDKELNQRVIEAYPRIAGLSRTKPSDIEATWDAIRVARSSRIHTFISTDSEHMQAKFPGKNPEQVLNMGKMAVRYAKSISAPHLNADVEFSAEAATTTEAGYLETVIKEAISEGADVINVPDTVGQRNPFWMYEFYSRVIDWVMNTNPEVTISSHNHNDLGQAVSNTGALVYAAGDYAQKVSKKVKIQLETTVCGLGERAGNADIFPVIASVFKFAPDMELPIAWRFNPRLSVSMAETIMGHAGFDVDRQSPIVGYDIKVHRSGIHSDGVIKGGHRIYTPYDPKFWGHTDDAIHEDGKYQGRAGKKAVMTT